MQRVLLIEDNPIEARLLGADFQRNAATEFCLVSAPGLSEAFEILKQDSIDVILLDLFLEGTAGLATLSRVREAAPKVPVVVLTGLNDEALALQALKNGAQDYLIKGSVNSHVLFRAIRYAIERKQAESDRSLLEQRLLESQKLEAVGTLAGGVAHNFNNTLMVILGHSKLMLEYLKSDDDNRRHVEAIVTAGERAALLIRQLLTFSSKGTAGPAVVSLNKLILDMHALLEATLNNGAELELKLDAKSEFVKASPSQIGQMLMSMVINARNAMPTGGKLTIETMNRTNGEVLLLIRDTGCGMSPETCAHLFEPFFTTKCLAEASGLGLSTVYGIVKHHGGNIQVTSEPGAGTTFSIVFPTLHNFASDTKGTLPSTILIVEDIERASECFDALDGMREYAIIKAGDWRAALDLADVHNGPIDLLIADAVTPGLLKPHIVKQLATEHLEMKILYISDSSAKTTANGNLPAAHLDQTVLTQETLLRSVKEALSGPPREVANTRRA